MPSRRNVARPALPVEVVPLARLVSIEIWKQPYRDGEGCFHFGGGPAHREMLLTRAKRLREVADAATTMADYLPDGDDFYDVPARRVDLDRVRTALEGSDAY